MRLTVLQLLGQTAQQAAQSTTRATKLAQNVVQPTRLLLLLLRRIGLRQAFQQPADTAGICLLLLLLLAAAKDTVHHVLKPVHVGLLGGLRRMLAAKKAIIGLLATALAACILGHIRHAFGNSNTNCDFRQRFHQ